MQRSVKTECGEITYYLERKRVKNLNLRINSTGKVMVSIPNRCGVKYADELICKKAEWITTILTQREKNSATLLPAVTKEESRSQLMQAVEAMYPLVREMGVTMPAVKVRKMKSQWGNCHWAQGYITLNTALSRCPRELREYVALHELVHFLHHDHSVLFYGAMDQRMPDWRERRSLLKRYHRALEDHE